MPPASRSQARGGTWSAPGERVVPRYDPRGGGRLVRPTLELHLLDHVVVRLELLVLLPLGRGRLARLHVACALAVLPVLALLLRALELALHLVHEDVDRREGVLVLDLPHVASSARRGDHLDLLPVAFLREDDLDVPES